MEITLNPLELTKEQREHIAGFILTFPPSCMEVAELQAQARTLEVLSENLPDPIKAFGGIIPSPPVLPAVISNAGPTLVFPNPTVANVPAITQNPVVSVSIAAPSVDKQNFPWDARIHAGGKATNADGTWRRKRGITAELIAQVEAELRQLMAIPSPAQMVIPAPPVTSSVPPPPTSSPVPAPPATGPTEADLRNQFVKLFGEASAAIMGGKITVEEVNAICTRIGIANLQLLATRLDLIPQVAGEINALIASR